MRNLPIPHNLYLVSSPESSEQGIAKSSSMCEDLHIVIKEWTLAVGVILTV